MSRTLRLNKFISDTGHCSRREADALIERGRVTVNGRRAVMGTLVEEGDAVCIDGRPLRRKPPTLYLAFNKPAGVTCTTERQVPGNIIDFIGHPQRIFPIGRLDKPSQGLIFLTNDGDIVNKILRAGNAHEKEYQVSVDKPITEAFLKQMAQGVRILDTVTLPCRIQATGPRHFTIVLTQGLNRQIRRMCEVLGYEVQTLKRVRIMNITLQGLPEGRWRYLSAEEVANLNDRVAHSDAGEKASRVAPKARRSGPSQTRDSAPGGARPPARPKAASPRQAPPAGARPARGKARPDSRTTTQERPSGGRRGRGRPGNTRP